MCLRYLSSHSGVRKKQSIVYMIHDSVELMDDQPTINARSKWRHEERVTLPLRLRPAAVAVMIESADAYALWQGKERTLATRIMQDGFGECGEVINASGARCGAWRLCGASPAG
jgi:hypothetical protein